MPDIASFSESMSDGLDQLPLELGHTQLDPCTNKHSQPKCVPAQQCLESSTYALLCSSQLHSVMKQNLCCCCCSPSKVWGSQSPSHLYWQRVSSLFNIHEFCHSMGKIRNYPSFRTNPLASWLLLYKNKQKVIFVHKTKLSPTAPNIIRWQNMRYVSHYSFLSRMLCLLRETSERAQDLYSVEGNLLQMLLVCGTCSKMLQSRHDI